MTKLVSYPASGILNKKEIVAGSYPNAAGNVLLIKSINNKVYYVGTIKIVDIEAFVNIFIEYRDVLIYKEVGHDAYFLETKHEKIKKI